MFPKLKSGAAEGKSCSGFQKNRKFYRFSPKTAPKTHKLGERCGENWRRNESKVAVRANGSLTFRDHPATWLQA
jgi:hypothetical protein